MQTINRESDFIIKTSFLDDFGIQIPIPDYDFEFEYFVYPESSVKAGKTGNDFINCYPEGDLVVVAIDEPGFSPGLLKCKKTYSIPDDRFPDGIRKTVETTTIAKIC